MLGFRVWVPGGVRFRVWVLGFKMWSLGWEVRGGFLRGQGQQWEELGLLYRLFLGL